MKICLKCHLSKLEQEFGIDNSKKDKLLIYCKQCIKKSYRFHYPKKEKVPFDKKSWRRSYRAKQKQNYPEKFLLESSKYRARKKGLINTLILNDIIIPKNCPVLGIPIFINKEKQGDNSPSIDRIDNTRGYTSDNIIIISWKANNIKGNASIKELEKIVFFYKNL